MRARYMVLVLTALTSACPASPEFDPVPARLRGPTSLTVTVGGEVAMEVAVEEEYGGLIEDATVDYFFSCDGMPDGCPAMVAVLSELPLRLAIRGVRRGVMQITFRHGYRECVDPPMCYIKGWVDIVDPLQTTIAVRE